MSGSYTFYNVNISRNIFACTYYYFYLTIFLTIGFYGLAFLYSLIFFMPEFSFTNRTFGSFLINLQFLRPLISLSICSGAHLYFNIRSLSKFFFNSRSLRQFFIYRFYARLFNYQSICTPLFSIFLSEFTPVFFSFINLILCPFFYPWVFALVFLYLSFFSFSVLSLSVGHCIRVFCSVLIIIFVAFI